VVGLIYRPAAATWAVQFQGSSFVVIIREGTPGIQRVEVCGGSQRPFLGEV
jgi:hypothetical protein